MHVDELKQTFGQDKLDFVIEKVNGVNSIIIIPKDIKDFDFAITQGKNIGITLLKQGVIKSFSSGIDIVSEGQQLGCKFFIHLDHSSLKSVSSEKQDLSFLFYSDPPHLEQELLKSYCTGNGGVFVESKSGDGLTNSRSKFFQEFLGWTGLLIEDEKFPELFNNRVNTDPAMQWTGSHGAITVYGSLVDGKEEDNITKYSFNSLIETYNTPKVDWMHLNETEDALWRILDDAKTWKIKPNVLTFKYLDPSYSLANIKQLLEGVFKLEKVFYDYAIFLR